MGPFSGDSSVIQKPINRSVFRRRVGPSLTGGNNQEFLKFLKRLDAEFPVEIKLHIVMDNYGTHKHPKVQGWLQRHPRFVPHFIPTSSSWLNLVERWFGELTGKRIRRGAFISVDDLLLQLMNTCRHGMQTQSHLFGGNSRINLAKLFTLQTNFGEDSAGLYVTTFS